MKSLEKILSEKDLELHNNDPNAHQDIRQIISDFLAQFEGNINEPGYYRLPNGLIIQWLILEGTTGGNGYWGGSFPFPLTFPNRVLAIVTTESGSKGGFCITKIDYFNNSEFGFAIHGPGNYSWKASVIAIGF